MKLSNVPTEILVQELIRRGFVDDFHVVRFSAFEIELVHPLSCRAEPDDIATCEYGLVMMQKMENHNTFPVDSFGTYRVDLEDGDLVNWRRP